MKIILTICMMLCFLTHPMTMLVSASPVTDSTTLQDSPNTAAINTCHTLDATSALLGTQKLIDNAKAAILYEATSDTLMFTMNADERMYPASLVKIMTALIAVRDGDLSDMVTVTESAIASLPIDAVSADLVADEQISLEDLLYCLLVGSANDAAVVIAEHISGSQNTFIQLMNEYAQELGCTGTQFTNAHGLHNADQYTTARDAARILNAALKNEVFRSIFTAVKHTVPATNKSDERSLGSNNSLMDASSKLYYDPRVIGGRTGVTEDGRRCIATAAESNGMLLISVVMGSETTYQEDGYSAISVGGYHETTALLDAGFNGYKSAQILFANQALKQCAVQNGSSDVILGSQVSVSAVLPEAVTTSDLSLRYGDIELQAPIAEGQRVSSVQVWHGNMCVAEADLYAMNSVGLDDSVTIWHDTKDNSGNSLTVLWIGLGLIGGTAVVLLLIRASGRIRVLVAKNRNKRHRRNRRRSR